MVVWKFNNLYKADAEKVSKEIESISNATPSSILEFARNENSELHKCFEWDDTVAAEKYRLQQARNIVCNLVYQEEKKEEPTKLRVFYNQSLTNTYQPTRLLVRNEIDKYRTKFDNSLNIIAKGNLIPIKFTEHYVDEKLMSPRTGKPVLVRMNRFSGWSAEFTIQFTENVYSLEQIINIINLAGFGLGIGSGRTSGYGRYHVEEVR